MFKRLFFLSGIIAFLLTCVVMWFWYLPGQEATGRAELNSDEATDSVNVELVDTVFSEK